MIYEWVALNWGIMKLGRDWEAGVGFFPPGQSPQGLCPGLLCSVPLAKTVLFLLNGDPEQVHLSCAFSEE